MVDIKKFIKNVAIFGAGAGTGYVVGKKNGIEEIRHLLNDPEAFSKHLDEAISAIISAFDHDLSAKEELQVREALAYPGIFREFLSLIGIGQSIKVDKQLLKDAIGKFDGIMKSNDAELRYVHGFFTNMAQPRRLNVFCKYIMDHRSEDIVQTVVSINEAYVCHTNEYHEALWKAFGIEVTVEEDAAYGVEKFLMRKQIGIAREQMKDFIKKSEKSG